MMQNITVLETGSQRMVSLDIQSKLLQNNIIMITGPINTETVTEYQTQLFYLMSRCSEEDTITLYINSPGGSVYDGLGLYDTIQLVKKNNITVRTVNIGMCCSMASILLMCGSKGHRDSTANSSVMVHEISTIEVGKTPDIIDATEEMKRLQTTMDKIIEENSSKDLISLCNRKDLWLSAEDAKKYNIIDNIL